MLLRDLVPFLDREDEVELDIAVGEEIFMARESYNNDDFSRIEKNCPQLIESKVMSIGLNEYFNTLKIVVEL